MNQASPVTQMRVVLCTDDFEDALMFYRDALGLPESAALAGEGDARVVILEAGRATLELANPAQDRFIAAVETGGIPSTPVRLAFQVDDARTVSDSLTTGGARLIAPPVLTPWNSLNARLAGAGGVQVTVFQELSATPEPDITGARPGTARGDRSPRARRPRCRT